VDNMISVVVLIVGGVFGFSLGYIIGDAEGYLRANKENE
jgi:hypothetical protein